MVCVGKNGLKMLNSCRVNHHLFVFMWYDIVWVNISNVCEIYWIFKSYTYLYLFSLERLFREQWLNFRNYSSPFGTSNKPRSDFVKSLTEIDTYTPPPLSFNSHPHISIYISHPPNFIYKQFLAFHFILKTHTPTLFLSLLAGFFINSGNTSIFRRRRHRKIFRRKLFLVDSIDQLPLIISGACELLAPNTTWSVFNSIYVKWINTFGQIFCLSVLRLLF